jgi:hypothetical protein
VSIAKKELERLAKALADSRPPMAEEEGTSLSAVERKTILKAKDEQWVATVHAICDVLEELNPRFDRDIFTTYVQTEGYTSRR